MYDDETNLDVCPADLAFEELSLQDRKTRIDLVLGDLKPKRSTYLLKRPDLLGVEVEAGLIDLQSPEDLHRYLQPSDLDRLAALVSETLMARLPAMGGAQFTLF